MIHVNTQNELLLVSVDGMGGGEVEKERECVIVRSIHLQSCRDRDPPYFHIAIPSCRVAGHRGQGLVAV